MRTLAYIERSLWVAGVACVGYVIVLGIQAQGYGRIAQRIDSPTNANSSDQVIGRIEIPALGLTAPITRDYDVNSLRKGVGHIPTTAEPGGLGTVGLAGHRDSFFRPLRRITSKMEIRLTNKSGVYHYVVDTTEVVNPDQVRVLDTASRPTLTLITCFPFDYVGAAPQRFIVHAHLLSVVPDAVSVGSEKRQ